MSAPKLWQRLSPLCQQSDYPVAEVRNMSPCLNTFEEGITPRRGPIAPPTDGQEMELLQRNSGSLSHGSNPCEGGCSKRGTYTVYWKRTVKCLSPFLAIFPNSRSDSGES